MTDSAIISAPASKVRKVRVMREVRDTREVIFAVVLEVIRKFNKEADKVRFTKAGQAVANLESGDTQPNRRAMISVLKNARQLVAKETAQAEARAFALAEYNALIAPVVDGWKAANEAWIKSVQAEKANGHNGQKAVANAFWSEYARFEPLVLKPRGTKEAVAELAYQLEDLAFRVGNFVWDYWCTTCGTPVDEIVIPGKKPFWPKLCGRCFRAGPIDDSVAEAKPRKHVVKKPGSAGARHKGVAKKAKGTLTAKDEAKNTKLLAEAAGIAHQGKPNTKQPKKQPKAGKTKTKKQGLGS